MSGWYVNTILRNSSKIRSDLYKESVQQTLFRHGTKDIMSLIYQLETDGLNVEDEFLMGIILAPPIDAGPESDDSAYDDLLSIEMTVKKLVKEGVLKEEELLALNALANGNSIREIAAKLKVVYLSAWQLVNDACSKIAFCLGDHFTDDGFIVYMINKYHLDAKDGIILDSLMHRNYAISRKEYNV